MILELLQTGDCQQLSVIKLNIDLQLGQAGRGNAPGNMRNRNNHTEVYQLESETLADP